MLRVGRPVLAIVGGAPQLEFKDSESARLARAASGLGATAAARARAAVGRIEVTGLPDLTYVGTGWLVEQNTIVTNRHVAREFGRRRRRPDSRSRKGAAPRPIGASIDFLEEVGRAERLEFPIVEILHIEDERRTGLRAPARRETVGPARRSRRRFRSPPRPSGPSSRSP